MFVVYNLLIWAVLPLIVLYHLYRSVSRGRPAALGERFGFIAGTKGGDYRARPIWVHAVSVGESIACRPLLRALRARYPDRRIILSNMTETGRSVASAFPEVDRCLYFPFDYRFAVRRMLRLVRPSVILVVETELWPNFLREARLMGIPTVVVNGRISDRSFAGYMRARRFFRPVLAAVTRLCMQSDEDARRIVALGAPPERVTVARNLKFDLPASPVSAGRRAELRRSYGIPVESPVIVAGSTHEGEEAAMVRSYLTMAGLPSPPFLVIVPRHPERAAAVAELVRENGLTVHRRSELGSESLRQFAAGDVFLVDTVGELMQFYALADLAFVGGSLVPNGGHNLLEPASLGVPVLFGPHMNNFREIAALVTAYGAGCAVEDADRLTTLSRQLMDDPERRRTMGEAGIRLVTENGGATDLHMAVVDRILQGAP